MKVAPPLTQRQAARLEPLGLLADEPAGLIAAWDKVAALWSAAVAQARRLPPDRLDERVNGEWSFIETIRHLIFVSDAWIGDVVEERASPYDPLGLPPDFITNGKELGLDPDARPSLADVLDQFTVLGAVQNVIFEEWAHYCYAVRDVVALE